MTAFPKVFDKKSWKVYIRIDFYVKNLTYVAGKLFVKKTSIEFNDMN